MKYTLKQIFKVEVFLKWHTVKVRWQRAVATYTALAYRDVGDGIEEIKRGGCRLDLLGCEEPPLIPRGGRKSVCAFALHNMCLGVAH